MQAYDDALRLGGEAIDNRDFKRAMDIFDQCSQIGLGDVRPLVGMAIALAETGYQGASIGLLMQAANLRPNVSEIWSNLGASLRKANQTEAARAALLKAIELNPNDGIAFGNLTGTYINEGDPAAGLEYGRKAVKLEPDNVSNHNNLAFLYLELGRWQEAWPHWERRVMMPGATAREYPGRRWRGERVDSLVVHGEQGLGDEVMFLAYAQDVAKRVRKRLVIEVAPRLKTLAQRSFPDAEVIGHPSEFTGEADAWVAMGDLAALFNGGVPVKRSRYLVPDPERVAKWREKLPQGAILLAHKGGTKRTHEEARNPPREAWAHLLALGRPVFSIQYGKAAKGMADEIGIEWLEDAANDLEEQVAAISACDALVSVAQTALHFGGALGKRVLCVCSDRPAWRYGLKGPMPWYETVELYRRAPDEPWDEVVQRVAEALS